MPNNIADVYRYFFLNMTKADGRAIKITAAAA
jgi:hypothetical protein